jgi:hypothetical protein
MLNMIIMIRIVTNDNANDLLGETLQLMYPNDIHNEKTHQTSKSVYINMLDEKETGGVHVIDEWAFADDAQDKNPHIICRSDISKKVIQMCTILKVKYDPLDRDDTFAKNHKNDNVTKIEITMNEEKLRQLIDLYYPGRFEFVFVDIPSTFTRNDTGYVLRTLVYTAR